MLFLIIALLIILAGIAIILILHLRQERYTEFVLKNSVSLKNLNEINSRYTFNPYISYDQTHTYDNEKFYDNISCKDYLIYQLQFESIKIRNQIHNLKINKERYSSYISEVAAATQFGQFQYPIGRFKLKKLIKIEKLLAEKQIYPTPYTQFSLRVTLYCSRINGRIYDHKSEIFSSTDILKLIKRLNNKNGTFYYDREIWDAICRVERGKVSNKMRFAIYERDGYRCRYCGIHQNYADLEIDHIIPIAKGGKSTFDNLQTLCHKCNVEKGDRLY